MFTVKVYDVFNNVHEFSVRTKEAGREYAKRIITEGLWFIDGNDEVFYPVHQIVKVKIVPANI
jgi:hypothetical protein